jgi:putative addiction module component (TIGR02574 family)
MSVAEIKQELSRLTNAERVELLEAIWDSLEDKDEIESPEWHGKVLAERAAKIESGEAQFLTLEQVKEQFGR